jgi:hypothetical protein
MPTNDGISDGDWDLVSERIVDIVNAVDKADTSLLRGNLVRILRQLEDKYGRLASLVDTEADFTWDRRSELMLRREAYAAAMEQDDELGLTAVSKALAEHYLCGFELQQGTDENIEAPIDVEKGRFWLEKLAIHMQACADEFDQKDYAELKQKLDSLSSD